MRRIRNLTFATLMAIGVIAVPVAAHATTCAGTSVTSWAQLQSALPVSGSATVCIGQTISFTTPSTATNNLSVAAGTSLTLDLAGHSLSIDASVSNFVAAIHVPATASITITDSVGGGSLTVLAGAESAGIGGNPGESAGTITITGGTINATGGINDPTPTPYVGGAAIGSGAWDNVSAFPSGGHISISGGVVTATGGTDSAGIGGGYVGSGGTIQISGGTVTATGSDGAGIGSGYDGATFDVTITGGTINASGGSGFGSGIGAGSLGRAGTVNISGGANVTAIPGALQTAHEGIGPTHGGSPSTVTVGQSSITTLGSMITLAAAPTLPNATFAGWVVSPLNSLQAPATTYTFGSSSSTVNVSPGTTATVTYSANGGSGTTPSSTTYTTFGTPITVANGSTLTRTGYEFTGWNTSADGSGTSLASGSTQTPSANVTLYAQWKSVLATTGTSPIGPLSLALLLITVGLLSLLRRRTTT